MKKADNLPCASTYKEATASMKCERKHVTFPNTIIVGTRDFKKCHDGPLIHDKGLHPEI